MRSFLGRLSADPGSRQSHFPSTVALRCRDPALKDSPGHPCLNTHLHTLSTILRRKQPPCLCAYGGVAGMSCFGACPPPSHQTSCESPPDSSHSLWDVPAFGDVFRNCSFFALQPETYHVKCCEDFSPLSLSILPPQTVFIVSLPRSSPLSAHRQCLQPCCALQRSCSWAQLSLCSTATCHYLPPSQEPSPAQQQRTSPRQHFHCLLPPPPFPGSLEVSLGLQG